jgi:predicted DNA-binding protein (UPF0251 family)
MGICSFISGNIIMTRPKYCRKIGREPGANYFKPHGIPVSNLEEVIITLDEFEALRLADFEGLYHENSAANMNISRQTFGRIIDSARKKIADALVHGKALKIEGGIVSFEENGEMKCSGCDISPNCCKNTGSLPSCPRCRKIKTNSI